MATLYILCGVPGSGKSYWAKHNLSEKVKYVSRDEIRFNLVKDEEDYFSHEKEVFRLFSETIATYLMNDEDVVADATHLNEFSRRKLTQALSMKGVSEYEIIYVVFMTNINTCIERNNVREGKSKVAENVIYNMYRQFRVPTLDEDYRAKEVLTIE